jgi:hypothetical protein
MKKLVFGLSMLALIGTSVFVSCNKSDKKAPESSTVVKTDALKQIQIISQKYSKPSNSLAKKVEPNGGRVVAADAVGAAAGAFGSILGSIVCGTLNSIYDLYQQGALGGSKSKSIGVNGGSSNSNNPYDYLGTFHNTTIMGYMNQNGQNPITTGNATNVNSFVVNAYTSLYTASTSNINFANNFDFIQTYTNLVVAPYNSDGMDGIINSYQNAGYLDASEVPILSDYLYTLMNCSTLADGQNYSIACENAIVNSTLPQASIQKLLICMSIGRNSYTLYFGANLL